MGKFKFSGIILVILLVAVVFQLPAAPAQNPDRLSVAVILSGGGAKGIGHIPFLESLERHGIPIDMIMGTSMGSLIAGLYAAGYTPGDIRRLIDENNLVSLFTSIESAGYRELMEPFVYSRDNILTLSFDDEGFGSVSGLIDDSKVLNFFEQALDNIPEDMDFDDLDTAYRCIGTNAITGEKIIFEDGSLIHAMRSSMSIPLVFVPSQVGDKYIMDGGLVDNMPAKLAHEMGYDLVLCEDVNGKIIITADSYNSFSSSADAVLHLVVQNNVKEQLEYADIYLTPDMNGIGTMDFGKTDEIIHRGEVEVAAKENEIAIIAQLFSEDQKEYRDPERVGNYFSIPNVAKQVDSSAKTPVVEALSKSRIFAGFFGSSSLSYIDKSQGMQFRFAPSFRGGVFLKNLLGSQWGMNLNVGIGSNLDAEAALLYKIAQVGVLKVFLTPTVDLTFGSLSPMSDRANRVGRNTKDFSIGGGIGIKVTDEMRYNTNLMVTDYLYVLTDLTDAEESHVTSYPSVSLNGIWYGDLENGLFATNGLRADFELGAGYFKDTFTYKMAFALEQDFALTPKVSLWYDLSANSSREPIELTASYYDYGTWNGMPGFPSFTLVRDMLLAGVGVQVQFDGILDHYIQFQVRGGMRSPKTAFSMFNTIDPLTPTPAPVTAPFSELSDFDIGLGGGWGFHSPVADFLFGVGVNFDGEVSLYFEIW